MLAAATQSWPGRGDLRLATHALICPLRLLTHEQVRRLQRGGLCQWSRLLALLPSGALSSGPTSGSVPANAASAKEPCDASDESQEELLMSVVASSLHQQSKNQTLCACCVAVM